MTVIFPGGDFWEFILNCIKNKFIAGNSCNKKSPLFFLGVGGGRREEGGGEVGTFRAIRWQLL